MEPVRNSTFTRNLVKSCPTPPDVTQAIDKACLADWGVPKSEPTWSYHEKQLREPLLIQIAILYPTSSSGVNGKAERLRLESGASSASDDVDNGENTIFIQLTEALVNN